MAPRWCILPGFEQNVQLHASFRVGVMLQWHPCKTTRGCVPQHPLREVLRPQAVQLCVFLDLGKLIAPMNGKATYQLFEEQRIAV